MGLRQKRGPSLSVAPPVGRLGKGFSLSPTVAAILFLPGRELWRCYGLFTFRSGQPQTTALSVSSEKDCKKGKAKQIKPDGSIRAKTIHTNNRL